MGSKHGNGNGAARVWRGEPHVRPALTDVVTLLFVVKGVGLICGHSQKRGAEDRCLLAASGFANIGEVEEPVRYGERQVHWIPRVEVEFVVPDTMAIALNVRGDAGRAVKHPGIAVFHEGRVVGAIITRNGECTLGAFDSAWMVKIDGGVELVKLQGVI